MDRLDEIDWNGKIVRLGDTGTFRDYMGERDLSGEVKSIFETENYAVLRIVQDNDRGIALARW